MCHWTGTVQLIFLKLSSSQLICAFLVICGWFIPFEFLLWKWLNGSNSMSVIVSAVMIQFLLKQNLLPARAFSCILSVDFISKCWTGRKAKHFLKARGSRSLKRKDTFARKRVSPIHSGLRKSNSLYGIITIPPDVRLNSKIVT